MICRGVFIYLKTFCFFYKVDLCSYVVYLSDRFSLSMDDDADASVSSNKTMSTEEVLDFFSSSRMDKVRSFRALCNALKALSIAGAVRALRVERKGRMCVCDVGCGKGGDIGKWMPHRPKKLIGIDGSQSCISQARVRYTNLVANGRGIMEAFFHTVNLCSETTRFPVDNESVDIISSNFFMQFAAINTDVMQNVLRECERSLLPGGIFVCLVPDGDRIWTLLQASDQNTHFGHFNLKRCTDAVYDENGCACGVSYRFSLGDEHCSEYILFPKLLEEYLIILGFTGALSNNIYSIPAQDYFLQYRDNGVVDGILQGISVTHTDWLSLGLFRVFLCRKGETKGMDT